jgi:hypothetical protein
MVGTNGTQRTTTEGNDVHRSRKPARRTLPVDGEPMAFLSPTAATVARKPAGKRKAKPAPVACQVKPWAYAGVGLTLGLSGWLNGLAFSQSAPIPAYGWALGIAIPAALLIFSRVSALLYSGGRRGLSYAGAAACLSMLTLSVQHMAHSISRLTGEPVALAALMAVAIDAGLVVCELATVRGK